MASLKSLLGTKQDAFVSVAESNLEKGQIFTYHDGANYSRIWCGFCFHPDVSGTAVVEAWGAGGSGARGGAAPARPPRGARDTDARNGGGAGGRAEAGEALGQALSRPDDGQ